MFNKNRYVKAMLKACEKVIASLSRDVIEIGCLQSSRNLKDFVGKSKIWFERNIASELSTITESKMVLCESDGAIRSLQHLDRLSDGVDKRAFGDKSMYWFITEIDGWDNFTHGNAEVAFSISLMQLEEGREFNLEDISTYNIVVACMCLPTMQKIIFTESEHGVFISSGSISGDKVVMNSSINIGVPQIMIATDLNILDNIPGDDLAIYQHLAKRSISFLSSGSVLYDIARLLENKVDICIYHKISTPYLLRTAQFLVTECYGSNFFIEKQNIYIMGKQSIVNSIRGIFK